MKYDVTIQTISWFNGRRLDETLLISPKFQRRPVWLTKERSELIDTVCQDLPFPEVYIQVTTEPESGAQTFVVVDGQQRITSLLMFIDEEIGLPEREPWNGATLKDLNETQKSGFWDYKVVVRMLRNTSDAEIRELFTRLNTNNVALNDQELRNARYQGCFKASAERLADEPFFQSIGLFSAREIRRMIDIEFASELLLLCMEGITNKKDLLDDAYARYDEDLPGAPGYENDFQVSLSLVRSVVTPSNQALVKTKSNFYSLFGGCLRYSRNYKRTSFQNADVIAAKVGGLLAASRQAPAEGAPQAILAYFEAVSRAASDKSRRTIREDILYGIIQDSEPEIVQEASATTGGRKKKGR